MSIKFIQINIYKGKYLDNLVEFLKKEDPDIVAMQEVSAGTVNLYEDKRADLFELLKEKLAYNGFFHSDVDLVGEPTALFGNALFSKYPILKSEVVVLNTFRPLTFTEFHDPIIWAKFPRHMIDVLIDCGDFKIHAISVHGRRIAPPVDDFENVRQAEVMVKHLKALDNEPFIVGGDFNMPPDTQVIKILSKVATNLMENSNVSQTLNSEIHELGKRGYLVDYIFTSKHFRLLSLKVPQVTVSDHLPVIAELELLF